MQMFFRKSTTGAFEHSESCTTLHLCHDECDFLVVYVRLSAEQISKCAMVWSTGVHLMIHIVRVVGLD